MNCRLALQVFSRKVSAALMTASLQREILSRTATNTATFLLLINDLFDNANSRKLNDPNPHKCSLSNLKLQVEANLIKQKFDCLEWRAIKGQSYTKPSCFQALQQSISATIQLWHDLQEEGTTFLMVSRLQQDPIENLFSMIRMYGGTYNPNPSAKMFRLILQKNIMWNLSRPAQSANCLDDEDDILLDASVNANIASSSLECVQDPTSEFQNSEEVEDIDAERPMTIIDDVLLQLPTSVCTLESCAIEYFAGYIAMKNFTFTNCDKCKNEVIEKDKVLMRDEQILIFLLAYITKDKNDFGNLTVPTKKFSIIFRIMNALFDALYPSMRMDEFILDKIFPYLVNGVDRHDEIKGWFNDVTCEVHRKYLAYTMMRIKIDKDTVWLE